MSEEERFEQTYSSLRDAEIVESSRHAPRRAPNSECLLSYASTRAVSVANAGPNSRPGLACVGEATYASCA